MTTKVSTTWVLALVGWAVHVVVLVVFTVANAHHAATLDPEREASNVGDAVFLSLLGPLFHTLAAVVCGLIALLLLVVLGLSIRPGLTRLVAVIIGIVVEVPVVAVAVSALQDGAGVGELVVLAGGALVLVGVVSPSTWRWCRRVPVPVSVSHPAQ